MVWTLEAATQMCRQIESICPAYGAHVALTGGVLYKDGQRKDVDILFYCIRQVDAIDMSGLFKALISSGMTLREHKGWVTKGDWQGKPVDMFFPEAYPASSLIIPSGEY